VRSAYSPPVRARRFDIAMKRRVAFGLTFAVTALPLIVVLGVAGLESALAGAPLREALSGTVTDLVTVALAQALGTSFVLFLGLAREAPDSYREALFVAPLPGRTLLVAFLAGLAMHLLVAETANVIEEVLPRSMEQKVRMAALLAPRDLASGLALVLAVIVVAPVSEELFFRGLVLPRLSLRTGTREALLLSAMLFGVSHALGGPHVVIPATLAGLALGYVARAQRSVLASMAMHAGSNALPLLVTPAVARVPGLNQLHDGPLHLSPVLVGFAALVMASAIPYLSRDLPDDPA
jgi:membrane protease YdiL (CAAX protease family)